MRPPPHRLRLLGAPELCIGDELVHLSPRKAVALLAYLAVEARPHARDELAAMFWPDVERSAARSNLRNLLWIIGRSAEGVLDVEGDRICVRPDRLTHDVGDFLACAQQAVRSGNGVALDALRKAERLARGPFLDGFSLDGVETFESWREARASMIRSELVRVLGQLAVADRQRGDSAAAEATLRRLVQEEPYDEHGHAELIELLASTGRRTAALRHYEAYVRLLADELGVAPGPALVAMVERVRNGAASSPRSRPERSAGSLDDSGPVGREREWSQLRAALAAAEQGGRVISIQGEPGIGKTFLAEAFATGAREAGAGVLVCRCYEGEAAFAYGPLIDALERVEVADALRDAMATLPPAVAAEASRLLPSLPAPASTPPAEPIDGRRRFLDAVARLLHALLDGEPPGVLVVDDAQWADPSTLELLAFVARRLESRPLLIVLTWRDDGTSDAPRLPALISELRRMGRVDVLRLGRLDESDVRELAAQRGWQGDTERLYHESEGLPLLVMGAWTDAEGNRADDGAERALPASVKDYLHARLRDLDPAAESVLLAVAVLPRPADARLLTHVSGCDDEDTVAALETLLRRGVLVEVGGSAAAMEPSTYAFGHGSLRAFVQERGAAPRYELFHRRAAQALAERWGSAPGPAAAQVAMHHRLGGQPEAAAQWHARAAAHAASLYAHSEAVDHVRAALELGHPAVADLHEQVADLEVYRGRYREALEALAAAERAEPVRWPRIRHKTGNVHVRRGAWEEADAAFREAHERIEPDRRSSLLADWSFVASRLGRDGEAIERAEAALREATSPHDQARAYNHLGLLMRGRGESRIALRHFDRALSLTQGRDPVRVAALNNLARLVAQEGDHRRAESLSREALELCRQIGDRHHEAALHSNLADLLHARGDLASAMDHLKAAAAIYADVAREAEEWRPEVWMRSEW